MPYQPPKKNYWQYKFIVPNLGLDGNKYQTHYEFRIDLPRLSEFEREQRLKGYKIEAYITIYIIQGNNRIRSQVPLSDFIDSPLCKMISNSAEKRMTTAIDKVKEDINQTRENFLTAYGTYYNNGTVYKEDTE